MTTTLTVADRIASVSTDEKIVAGNTYTVAISVDAEWTGTYYLRIRFGSLYYDIPVSSSSVDVQIPVGYPEVGLGLYSDALSICTNEARIKVIRSILEQGVSVVEFDTDLYNQWAGEVSELVCDDAFDASSAKPLKNSVITTWKNSLPEYVTLTGSQTISGLKTFSTLRANTITLSGSADQFTIAKNSNNTVTMDVDTNGMMFTGKLGGHDFPSALGFRVEDGTVCLVTNTYTGSSGLVVVNKQMLANDTSIVRVTGNQTIDGVKTFNHVSIGGDLTHLSELTNLDNQFRCHSKYYDIKDGSYAMFANKFYYMGGTGENRYTGEAIRIYKPDRSGFYGYEYRAYADCILPMLTGAYFPVDGQGNPQSIVAGALETSGQIAVDPRIVHTTGNETVAGNKTFTGVTFIDNPRFKRVESAMQSNVWKRFYTFVPQSYGGFVVARFYDTYYIYGYVGAEVRIRQGNPSSNPDGRLYNVGTNIRVKLAKRSADGVVEVWFCQTSSGTKGIRTEIVEEAGGPVTPALMEGSMPEVGDTYSTVVDAEVIS